MIPESHPLRQLFLELVNRHYAQEMGLRDAEMSAYVANVLTDFCEV